MYQEAIGLDEPVVEALRRTVGPDLPDTLTAAHNLTSAYADAGMCRQAVDVGGPGLEAHCRVLGADHHHTLTTVDLLAAAYREMGRPQDAAALFRE